MKKEEPKVEEKKAVAAASKSTVERKAKYDLLTSAYRSIPDEEAPAYVFSSTLPELYSLDLDVLRLTAQYTAVNGNKVGLRGGCEVVPRGHQEVPEPEPTVRLFEAYAHSERFLPVAGGTVPQGDALR